eukprot:Hpha_TRINITY_DN11481_c0_g1::TRINITY_DN11481_c0_g1_i1::g.137554::m.137554/K13447/RBOH; respiratory burst oxidase
MPPSPRGRAGRRKGSDRARRLEDSGWGEEGVDPTSPGTGSPGRLLSDSAFRSSEPVAEDPGETFPAAASPPPQQQQQQQQQDKPRKNSEPAAADLPMWREDPGFTPERRKSTGTEHTEAARSMPNWGEGIMGRMEVSHTMGATYQSSAMQGQSDDRAREAMEALAGAGSWESFREYVASKDNGLGLQPPMLSWELLKRAQLSDDALRELVQEFVLHHSGFRPSVLRATKVVTPLREALALTQHPSITTAARGPGAADPWSAERIKRHLSRSGFESGQRQIMSSGHSTNPAFQHTITSHMNTTNTVLKMRRYLSAALGESLQLPGTGLGFGAEDAEDEDVPGLSITYAGRNIQSQGDEDIAEFAKRLRENFTKEVGADEMASEADMIKIAQNEGIDTTLAKWLFQAISRGEPRVDSRSFVAGVMVLAHGTPADRMLLSFHIFDKDRDGRISAADLAGVLKVACEENKLRRSTQDIETLSKGIIELVGTDRDSLTQEDFAALLAKHPELADTLALRPTKRDIPTVASSGDDGDTCCDWLMTKKRKKVWMLFFTLAHIGCFVWMFLSYGIGEGKKETELMEWSLPVAKGFAGALKLSFSLLLLPVSRHTMTALRSTPLAVILPLDDAVTFHRFVACIGGTCALGHALAHINDIKNWCDSSRSHLWALAKDDGSPPEDQPSCGDLLKSPVAITGMLMLLIFLIGFPFALKWPREAKWFKEWFPRCAARMNDFNSFWVTHQLLISFYILLLIHPWPGWPKPKRAMDQRADTWIWVGVPILIYVSERLYRACVHMTGGAGGLRLLEGSKVVPGKVTRIRVRKPEGWAMVPGQWAFVQVPRVSRYEWHPFTISSAPADPFIEFHIRAAGDWTSALHELFKNLEEEKRRREAGGDLGAEMLSWPKVRVDGPFGAPAQHFARCPVAILVGAGIGMTPFISILRDFVHRAKAAKCRGCGAVDFERADFPVKRAYFFFITRDVDELQWVREAVENIAEVDQDSGVLVRPERGGVVDINLHVTSMRGTKSFSGALLAAGEAAVVSVDAASPLSGVKGVGIKQGRPDWNGFLAGVRRTWEKECNTVSVSFCGPAPAASALKNACEHATESEGLRFTFRKESFG